MKPADRPLEFLSLFAGAGDLGLEQAGWTCRYAVDSDADAVATLRANQGPDFAADALLECADVRELTGRQLLKRLGRKKGEIPLMAGGPPCQSWSSAGKQQGFEDPRGTLFEDFVRLAHECGCRMIVFENVRGLLTARGPSGEPGEALRIIRETLLERGFRSEVRLINAADYGVPQRRVRLFIVGYRNAAAPVFPEPTHARPEPGSLPLAQPWMTLGEVLKMIAPPQPDEVIRPAGVMAERLRGLGPGEGAKSRGKRKPPVPAVIGGICRAASSPTPPFPPAPSPPARSRTGSCCPTAPTAASARANAPRSRLSPGTGGLSATKPRNTARSATPCRRDSPGTSDARSPQCSINPRIERRFASTCRNPSKRRSATPKKSTCATASRGNAQLFRGKQERVRPRHPIRHRRRLLAGSRSRRRPRRRPHPRP
jgi:DNA (cytosine-5)-methyltransferase 1